jgi:mono/diheme cytochrome c family protein
LIVKIRGMSMRLYHVGIAIALTTVGAGALLAQAADPPRDANHVYDITCHYCHDNGIGIALKGTHLPPERIQFAVRHGFASMPAFPPSYITDAELAALAQMLSESAPPAAAPGTKP